MPSLQLRKKKEYFLPQLTHTHSMHTHTHPILPFSSKQFEFSKGKKKNMSEMIEHIFLKGTKKMSDNNKCKYLSS